MPKQNKPKKSEVFQKQNLIILILLLIFFIITLCFYIIFNVSLKDYSQNENNSTENSTNTATIAARIIDGDTFQLNSGDTVRLICIDTPEQGKQGYAEAKQFLSDLILNKQVRLEKDVSDKDAYGRLLRYVYVADSDNNEVFINKELVKQGYATLFPYGNDTKRCNEISG